MEDVMGDVKRFAESMGELLMANPPRFDESGYLGQEEDEERISESDVRLFVERFDARLVSDVLARMDKSSVPEGIDSQLWGPLHLAVALAVACNREAGLNPYDMVEATGRALLQSLGNLQDGHRPRIQGRR